MSDFNSSLPVRTETNGDVVARIVDGSIVSQAMSVDANGKLSIKLSDAAGNGITSQVNGAQQALDVGINVAGVQIDPRSIRALTSSDVVTANQGAPNSIANKWPVSLTDGTNSAAVSASGELSVQVTQPLPAGSNTIGAVTQASGPWTQNLTQVGGSAIALGQAAMSASLPVVIASDQSAIPVSASNFPSAVDTNYGVVGASTLRTAAEIGNASGAADFNNGSTGAQTLRVAANLAVAGSDVSALNPIPVSISAALTGTAVNNYNTATLAAAASSNHDYAITALKTFQGKLIHAAASGKLKIEVQISPDGSAFSTVFVGFNSTANPNIDIQLDQLVFLESGVGSKIRVIRTNLDKQSEDVYSTICGVEV